MKTKDLRPCDICGGSIVPFFYRLKLEFRQVGIDITAVNQVRKYDYILINCDGTEVDPREVLDELAALRAIANAAAKLRVHNMRTRQTHDAYPTDFMDEMIAVLIIDIEEAVDAAVIAGHLELRP